MDGEIKNHCAVRLQSIVRSFMAWKRIQHEIQVRFEKIFDPKRQEYYYYDTKLDIASWDKPLLLGDRDIMNVAQTYTDDEASIMIQRQLLRRAALRKVRMLYQNTIIATYDEGYEATYYFNPVTEHTTWELPEFMNHRLDYKYDDLPLGGRSKVKANDDSSSSDEESEDSEVSIDSEIIRARRKEKRRYPRSKAQVIVDTAEDNARSGLKHLSITDCDIDFRVSDRIWDLTNLVQLSLARNKLRKLSTKVEYLVKLVELDLSHNLMTQLPRQIADLSLLRIFDASYNRFRKFTGFLYKCSKLETINLEGNRLRRLPITVGNLELLKVTKQWEVGFGVLKNLKILNLSKNLFSIWPEQVDRNTKLQDLNLSNNYLRRVPLNIKKNTSLQVLNLSNNLLRNLPPAIYGLPLRRLILRHNCLEELPTFSTVMTSTPEFRLDEFTMSSLVYFDVSYNRLTSLGDSGHLGLLGPGLKRLYANDNSIEMIDLKGLSKLSGLIDMNLARNRIEDSIEEGSNKLTSLDMSENLLKAVPPFLLTAASLTTLDLSSNMISKVPERLFGSCVLITSLDLHNNQIGALPSNLFALRKVEYMDLSFNRINQAIPRMLENFTELRTLLLSNNAITELPDSIGALSNLEVLEVEDNKLTKFPDEGVVQLGKLKRVTTKQNDIKIRPWSLFDLPALHSWDMSWNRDIVCKYVDWDERERLFQNERDVASMDFLEVLLKRANWNAGYDPTDRLLSNDVLVSAFDYFDAKRADEDQREALQAELDERYREELKDDEKRRATDPEAKKTRKKKKKSTVEEKRAEREMELKNGSAEAFSSTLSWQRSFLDFFKRHLVRYSSPSNPLTEAKSAQSTQQVAELQSLGLRMQANKTSVQIMTSLRTGRATSHSRPDPLKALELVTMVGQEKRDFCALDEADMPSTTLIESLDMGNDFQVAITSFEYIIRELGVIAAVGQLEAMRKRAEYLRQMHTEQWTEKYGRRLGTPFLKLPAQGSLESKDENDDGRDETSETGSAADGVIDVGSTLMTSRSAQFTARTNNSEANELMDMALGELLGEEGGDMKDERERATTAASRKWPTLEEYLLAKAKTTNLPVDDIEVNWNEVTLEFESAEKSSRLADYDVPPAIIHAPFLLSPSAPTASSLVSLKRMRVLTFRSYFGLGLALLRRADALTVSIRRLEVAGQFPASLLDIAQRLGLDYGDLVADVIEDVWERVLKEDGKAQGSMIERKNRQMQNLMSMSGADGMDLEIDKEEEAEDAVDVAKAADKEEKEKKKKYYQQMKAQKKEAEDKADQDREALEDTTPTTTDQYLKDPPPGINSKSTPPVSESQVRASAGYVYKFRRLVVAWADQIFEAAAEILKLEGWDVSALGKSFADDNSDDEDDDYYNTVEQKKKGASGKNKPYDINVRTLWDPKKRDLPSCVPVVTNSTLGRLEIRSFYLMRARSLQYSKRYAIAITQYNNVLSLGGKKKAQKNVEMELVRVYIAMKDYEGAMRCLTKVVLDRIEGADRRFPEPWQLIRSHPLLAYFLMLITEGMRMQSFCGFKTMRAAMTFELTADGSHRRRKPIKESEESIEPKAAEQKRRVAAQAVLKKKTKAEKAREKDVAGLKDRIRSYLYDYKNKLEEAKSHFSAIDKNF